MSAILEIRGLRGGYLPGVEILQGIDLTLLQGETVGVIGLNGSGKSTLGKAVMNLIPYREGSLRYGGEGIERLAASDLARRGMAIMQQGGQVFQNLSVWENLLLGFGNQADNSYISTLSGMIPLLRAPKKTLQRRMADKLSGGERHQLALAMTLARHPRLVVLDEPSAGLSPRAVDEMYALLDAVRNSLGVTTLLIEQNVNKAIGFCDRCLLLGQGRIEHELVNKNIQEVESLMFKK